MSHLVAPFSSPSIAAATERLRQVYGYLVERASAALPHGAVDSWGTATKRVSVDLPVASRPKDVQKDKEALVEVVNMVATIERLLAGLQYLSTIPEYGGLEVSQCHPSTSDDEEGNDLVLSDRAGGTGVRLEACDVVSSVRDGNGKEASLLSKLGCAHEVQPTGVGLFIATSPEFARYLARGTRRWASKHYHYAVHDIRDPSDSKVLEIRGRNAQPITPAGAADARDSLRPAALVARR